MPTGGSATCSRVSCPKIEITPSEPSVRLKSPPIGTIANTKKAGISDRYGAILKTNRWDFSGMRSSLKNSFMPSAKVTKMPHGPAKLGPIRFCMSEMTLRRNQILNITATSKKTKATTTLSSTTPTSLKPKGSLKRGSAAIITTAPLSHQ